MKEDATKNPALVVFTEAFILDSLTWIWRLRPGGNGSVSEELRKRLFDNAVNMESEGLRPLYAAA